MNLMEVCAALAVLSIGTLGMNTVLASYNRMCDVEQQRNRNDLEALTWMETLVEKGLPCAKARGASRFIPEGPAPVAYVLLDSVPGSDLFWVTAGNFRRLVRCR